MARGSRTWAERFVVPALAGAGLTVSELLTVKFGAAKAGTTNGAGISAHGIWDLWHEVRGLGPRFVVPALAGRGLTVSELLTVKFGAAKAGTTNGAGISAHGIGDLWH